MESANDLIRVVIVGTEGTRPTRLKDDLLELAPAILPVGRQMAFRVEPVVSPWIDMPSMAQPSARLLLVEANSFGALEAMRLLTQDGAATFVAAQIDGIYPRIPFGARRLFKALNKQHPVAYIRPDVRRRNDASLTRSKRHEMDLRSLLFLALAGHESAQEHWSHISNTQPELSETPSTNGKVNHVPT